MKLLLLTVVLGWSVSFIHGQGISFESAANEFFVGFSRNNDGRNITLQLFVSTPERDPVNFNVEARGFNFNGVATNRLTSVVGLPHTFQVQSSSTTERNKGIRVKAEGDRKLTVYGFSYWSPHTGDAFLALPCSHLAVDKYEYYGITYPEPHRRTSDILLVGSEDNTTITTPSATITLNRLETYLISSYDSTGVKITSTKPISFFSNHRCTQIPINTRFCDHLTEQIPPTFIWGTSFFFASLKGRMSGEIIRIVAAQNSTIFSVNCTTFPQVKVYSLLIAGNWTEFRINPNSFCTIKSSAPILVTQFALVRSADDITGDPFIMMIPSVEQYSNNYVFNVPSTFNTNYITIYVSTRYYQPNKILLDSASLSTSTWTEIYCSSGRICGYITRMTLSAGNHKLLHVNSDAKIGVSVYGFNFGNSYGYPGGLKLTAPIDTTVKPREVIICFSTSSCGGAFTVVTQNTCCTHGIGPVGLSFLTSEHEDCQPCPVVFGFNQTEFIGGERSQNYTVEVGFLSGSVSQEVKGSIQLTPVTAGMGDVRLLGGNIIKILPRSINQQLVIFALLVDAVSQEEDETFTISLNLNTPLSSLGNNTTIISEVKGTIIDTSVVVFTIPGCSYWTEEKPNAVMPVRVLKSQSTLLANPVTLKLTPLTVAAAQSRGIIGDFPDDTISPNRAQEADFDGTVLEIVFPADENLSRSIFELPADILVVDDEINEAGAQQFIVSLRVFSALNISLVQIEKNTSICNIIDDDTIKIGFLQQSYDFQEPDHRTLFRNVTLIKEDNRITEQTYSLTINVNSSSMGLQAATLESVDGISYDYSIGPPGIVFTVINFPPGSQNITFLFFLNHDELPELTETFQASVRANNGYPTFDTPTNLFLNTLINIIDNDDAVIVGFEQLQYTVNETSGTVEVCIAITNPPPNENLVFEIVTEYISVTGTADGADFTEIRPSQRVNRFPISIGSHKLRKVCSNISIIDDGIYERNENFTLVLSSRQQSPSTFTLSIEPRITTITIIDEDDAVIGFIDAPYAANENGIAAIKIGVVSGRLQREVLVDFSVLSGSAVVGSDFSYSGPQTYTFDALTNVSTINIALMNDNVYELVETFQVMLRPHGQQLERMRIDPGSTYTTIFDDDVIRFNLNPMDNIINENGGSQTVSVVLVGEFIQELSFIVTASTDGANQAATAMVGMDYTAVSGTSLNFSSGASRTQSFKVPIINDSISELEEIMFVRLAPTAVVLKSGVLFSLSNHESARILFGAVVGSVTIKDDDVTTIGFNPMEYNVSEGAGSVEFSLRVLQGELGYIVDVLLFTSQGSAIDGQDYIGSNATSFRLTGTGSATIRLLIKDDNILEAQDTENFFGIIRFASTPFSNIRFSPARAVINILENDEVVIGFINQPYNVSEDDGTACVEVGVVSGILGRNISIQLAFSSKSAIYGSDYGNNTGSLVFTFNATHNSSAACVLVIKDNIFEFTEMLEATQRLLGQPSSPLVSLVSTSVITILDDDVLTFSFNQSSYAVSEDVGNATLNVSLSGSLGLLVAFVSVGIDDTSTLTSARAGSDYIKFPSRNLTFSNGTRFQTFTIPIISDIIPEHVETIVFNITSIIILRNGTYMPLSPQERKRIKVVSDYARVIIYDNIQCTHQALVVHTACLFVVWEAPNVACGRINGYEIHFFNTITDRVYNGRSSTVFFYSATITPSLGPQNSTYFQVRVTNGTWSEPVQLCP